MVLKDFTVDKLHGRIYETREEAGRAAAAEAGAQFRALLAQKAVINVMFAAAPSQNEFLQALSIEEGIDWQRVNAYHMDEYIGLPVDHPSGFGNFLRRQIFSKLPFKKVYYLNGNADPAAEAARYSELLRQITLDVCFMGIGENGHIAFNDPSTADFNEPAGVKVVKLEESCQMQQVHDGCFARLGEVPEYALTVTVAGLMAAGSIFCIVPAATKAQAVRDMLTGEISTACPASILRTHANARLYLDKEAGQYLLEK